MGGNSCPAVQRTQQPSACSPFILLGARLRKRAEACLVRCSVKQVHTRQFSRRVPVCPADSCRLSSSLVMITASGAGLHHMFTLALVFGVCSLCHCIENLDLPPPSMLSLDHCGISKTVICLYPAAGGTSGKEPTCQCRRRKKGGFPPWVGEVPWGRKWQPTPGFLPGGSRGQRSLAAAVLRVAKSQM